MLEYFGGSPKAIVPDNLKSAVTKGSKYAPVLNETFETFGEHYNTTILPARPHQPKDNPLVELGNLIFICRFYPINRVIRHLGRCTKYYGSLIRVAYSFCGKYVNNCVNLSDIRNDASIFI